MPYLKFQELPDKFMIFFLDICFIISYYINVAFVGKTLGTQNKNSYTGCGSVWLERHLREVEAAGSNPVTPTKFLSNTQELFCFNYS